MKIVARTTGGYIVEATAEELAMSAGYSAHASHTWPGYSPGNHREQPHFPIGTEIKPAETHGYLSKLREHERAVATSAGHLRALAGMLAAALPSTLIPPETTQDPS